MAEVTQEKFSCPACGKQYIWKPELAGKQAQCKCGSAIHVPQNLSPAQEKEDDGLYDLEPHDDPIAAKRSKPEQAAATGATDSGYRCPSCSHPMQPGTPLCAQCGFDMKTGKKTGKPSAAGAGGAVSAKKIAAPSATSGFGPPPRRKIDHKETAKAEMMKFILPLALLLVVIGGVVGLKWFLGASEDNTPQLGDDGAVKDMMENNITTELIKWMDEDPIRHMVMGMTTQQARGYAKKFYDMGAKQVLAFSGGMTTHLAIELPPEPEKRKQLFEWEARWHKGMGKKPAVDVGQQYLLIKMKI